MQVYSPYLGGRCSRAQSSSESEEDEEEPPALGMECRN